DDFMGTILSEEITSRAGGEYGEYRSFDDYVEMITAIGRTPVERSTDYRTRRRIDPDDGPHGPRLGPRADGTPMLPDRSSGGEGAAGDAAGTPPADADD
ncbi:7,8-didemethyl-8-hydroxy-5-deazariboflavin synthase subunit CofH, partial [Halorubrum distributum]